MRPFLIAMTTSMLLATAPSQFTLPPGHDQVEGGSLGFLAGITKRARQQILIGKELLQPLQGRLLDGLSFRRDPNTPIPLQGGSANMIVRISEPTKGPEDALPLFAANHGSVVAVAFSGTVSVPASTPPGSDPWAADQVVRLSFAQPIAYLGNHLCIELVGTSTPASSNWPIDCARQDVGSTVRNLGRHCSSASRMPDGNSLFVSAERLTIGATMEFSWLGRPLTPGILMVGNALPSGLDLTVVGMAGCSLWLQPLVSWSSSFAQFTTDATIGFGVANLELAIPWSPSMLGSSFAVQGANLEVGGSKSNLLGITLTQGLSLTLAASHQPMGMSFLDSRPTDLPDPLADSGQIVVNRIPVLRLSYQ